MPSTRYPVIDLLRGIAILMMFVFHFSFDLKYFGVLEVDFTTHPFWLNFRRVIVSSFLFLVGISLYLATRHGLNKRRFLKRLILLVVYAALVTSGSYFMFPNSFIYFGILHFIAAASVLGLLFTRYYYLNLVLGIGLILLDVFYSNAVFNSPSLNWIGLMTHLPYTEDYVPLIPWFGIVLIGMFTGRMLFHDGKPPAWISTQKLSNKFSQLLALGGRYSIHIYMLHQPVFIGLLWVVLG